MAQLEKQKWLGLFALIPSLAMIFTDQSILPVALPTIQRELHANEVQLQWTINSYLLLTAVLLLLGGKLGDRFGHKNLFCLGMLLFALSSALCGLSPTILFLILARALQGVGAALMIPCTSVLLMSLFPAKQRGIATGINVSISSLFLITAPALGGYLTQYLSWRWIFYINLPLALIGFLLTLLFIPSPERHPSKIDPWGALCFIASSSLFVTLLMEGSIWGWLSLKSCLSLVGTAFFASLFFLREKKIPHPFLDLSLFRHPIYRAVNISISSVQFVIMISVFRAIFFQEALLWSPLKTGVISVITSLPLLFIAPVAGKLADRFGSKLPISIGFPLLIYSFFWVGFFSQAGLSFLMVGLFAYGLGIPFIFTPSYTSAMNAIAPQKAGIAFATIATLRSLAATLAVAFLGSIINEIEFLSFKFKLLKEGFSHLPSSERLYDLVLGQESISHLFPSATLSQHERIQVLINESVVDGFFYSHVLLGLLVVMAFSLVFLNYKRAPHPSHQASSPAEGWD